jgi:CheY-like chemotaxis protein
MSSRTILIVDDEPHIAMLVQFCLRSLGARMLTATDGSEALQVMQRERVDLVLLDVQMRGIDGLATARAMRATPALADVPVILMTAGGAAGIEESGRELGVRAFFRKPFSPVELRASVARLLGP